MGVTLLYNNKLTDIVSWIQNDVSIYPIQVIQSRIYEVSSSQHLKAMFAYSQAL